MRAEVLFSVEGGCAAAVCHATPRPAVLLAPPAAWRPRAEHGLVLPRCSSRRGRRPVVGRWLRHPSALRWWRRQPRGRLARPRGIAALAGPAPRPGCCCASTRHAVVSPLTIPLPVPGCGGAAGALAAVAERVSVADVMQLSAAEQAPTEAAMRRLLANCSCPCSATPCLGVCAVGEGNLVRGPVHAMASGPAAVALPRTGPTARHAMRAERAEAVQEREAEAAAAREAGSLVRTMGCAGVQAEAGLDPVAAVDLSGPMGLGRCLAHTHGICELATRVTWRARAREGALGPALGDQAKVQHALAPVTPRPWGVCQVRMRAALGRNAMHPRGGRLSPKVLGKGVRATACSGLRGCGHPASLRTTAMKLCNHVRFRCRSGGVRSYLRAGRAGPLSADLGKGSAGPTMTPTTTWT